MLRTLLAKRNISIYALANASGISYSTINYIVNERTPIDKCSMQTFKSMADALNMSMDELYEECQYTLEDFEIFKSSVGHSIREKGQLAFIEEMLLSDKVEEYWEKNNKLQALYLVATVDYLSRINDIPLCKKYHEYRCYKLKEDIYPMSYIAHKRIVPTYELKDIIPEYSRYGIMEGDILNVR